MRRESLEKRRLTYATGGLMLAVALTMTLFGCDAQSAIGEEAGATAAEPELFGGKVAKLGPGPAGHYIGMQGVSSELLVRGGFLDKIGGMLRINLKGSPGTTVTNIQNATHVIVAKLTFEPDGFVGWHTHPGPAVVAVHSGELTIVNESDCVARVYEEGTAFVDPGRGNIHFAVNHTDDEVVLYATFIDIPAGQAPTQLLEEPGDCEL